MSSQFDFLEEYNPYAFMFAQDMEKTLYDQPLSALALGGRFLETIRNSLYQKHRKIMSKYNKNFYNDLPDEDEVTGDSFKRDDFSYDISKLSHKGVIGNKDAEKIIGAYKIRNRIHLNKIKDPDYDKKSALELYKKIFEISVWYCKHMDPTFKDAIEFKYPSKQETTRKKIPNVKIVKLFL